MRPFIRHALEMAERAFVLLIAGFTIVAMGQEIMVLFGTFRVELKDLLQMFIYAEVLGMLSAFYGRQRIPITLPLFIAMTALSRLIILQAKESEPVVLMYESSAILLIAIACWIVSHIRGDDLPMPASARAPSAD